MSAAPEIALYSGGSPLGISPLGDRKSTRLNSSHDQISYAVFCLKKKKNTKKENQQKENKNKNDNKQKTPERTKRLTSPTNKNVMSYSDRIYRVTVKHNYT